MKFINFTYTLLLVLFSHAVLAEEYQSVYTVDITGDDTKEVITYKIIKNGEKYDGSIIIKSKGNKVLWEHEYQMSRADLYDDLLMNEGNISLEHWVKHFFDDSLAYGAKFKKYKIQEDEINLEFLEFYSKQLNHSNEELKKLILEQKINNTFYYRASWREELVMLVYIPKLGQMVHYSGGEY